MKRRDVGLLAAALALVGLLAGGVAGARWLKTQFPDVHGPVGCVVLVPCVVLFLIGATLLAIRWWKGRFS